jgi:hypothetical protein
MPSVDAARSGMSAPVHGRCRLRSRLRRCATEFAVWRVVVASLIIPSFHNRSVQSDEHASAFESLRDSRIIRSLVWHYWSACSQLTSYTLDAPSHTRDHGSLNLL